MSKKTQNVKDSAVDPQNKLSLPSPPLTGQCQCGAIRYTCASKPEALYICYCLECQHQSGSAFGMSLAVPAGSIKYEAKSEDNVGRTHRVADSGNHRGGVFCRECGVRLWHYTEGANASCDTIKPGTLDQKVDAEAAVHIWTKRILRGLVVPEGATAFEGEPE